MEDDVVASTVLRSVPALDRLVINESVVLPNRAHFRIRHQPEVMDDFHL
jgi:hypothetical protein